MQPRPPVTDAASAVAYWLDDAYEKIDGLKDELLRVQRKCKRLKDEVKALRASTTAKEAAASRLEAGEYRQALSNIAHRLENGGPDTETLTHIVRSALELRGLKGRQRLQVLSGARREQDPE